VDCVCWERRRGEKLHGSEVMDAGAETCLRLRDVAGCAVRDLEGEFKSMSGATPEG
jgi:hypothetical protein